MSLNLTISLTPSELMELQGMLPYTEMEVPDSPKPKRKPKAAKRVIQKAAKNSAPVPQLPPRADNLEDTPSDDVDLVDFAAEVAEQLALTGDDHFDALHDELMEEALKRETADQFLYAADVDVAQKKYMTLSSQRILDIVESSKKGYEVISGECVPYYDFELYVDRKQGVKTRNQSFRAVYQKLDELFSEYRIRKSTRLMRAVESVRSTK